MPILGTVDRRQPTERKGNWGKFSPETFQSASPTATLFSRGTTPRLSSNCASPGIDIFFLTTPQKFRFIRDWRLLGELRLLELWRRREISAGVYGITLTVARELRSISQMEFYAPRGRYVVFREYT